MITYVDEKSSARYTKLFKDASEALKLQNEIATIGGYLDHLNELLKLAPKWVRLPVDEEVFKIDANSRKINVPKDFASNGVGIVGDELAEIVWFKIDRYFDIVDLGADPMKIYIQWETPAGDKGISAAYAISKEAIDIGNVKQDYIYFGWALTSELTKKAGTIKFNVRIVKVEDGTDSTGATKKYIAYSFNTQPASVSIKQGINYDFINNPIDIEDATELIGSRILYGNTAHSPKITTNLSSIAFSGQTLSIVAEAVIHNKENKDKPDHTDDPNPILTYQWYYKPFGDSEYKMVVGTAEDKAFGATAQLKVQESGKYYCVVTASYRVVDRKVRDTAGNDTDIAYHSSLATSETVVCEVPEPIKLSIICEDGKQPLPERYIINDEEPGQPWSIEMGDQKVRINGTDVSISELTCKVLKTAEGAILSEEALKEANFIEADAKIVDVAITTESKTIEGIDGTKVNVSDRRFTVQPHEDIENGTNPEGYYKLIISNTVNGSTIASDPTNICRVTKKVQPATELKIVKKGTKKAAKGFVVGDTLVSEWHQNGTVDEEKVLWYLQQDEKDPDAPTEDIEYPDTLIETTGKDLVVTEKGTYYFKVQTTLNGQITTSASSAVVSVN